MLTLDNLYIQIENLTIDKDASPISALKTYLTSINIDDYFYDDYKTTSGWCDLALYYHYIRSESGLDFAKRILIRIIIDIKNKNWTQFVKYYNE